MRTFKFIYTILFLLFCAGMLQTQATDIYKRDFECVNDNELFHTFFQDDEGFVWAGTAHSLYRYDGKQFCPIRLSSNISSRTIIVYQLLKSSKGGHYIATNKGLGHFDIAGHCMNLIHVTSNIDVRSIEEDGDGNVLIGSMTGLFIYKVKNDRLVAINKVPALPVNDIVHDSGYNYWIGSSAGAYEFNSREMTAKRINIQGLDGTAAVVMAKDARRHVLWFGTDRGLSGYDWIKKTTSVVKLDEQNTIASLILQKDGMNLWIGTDNGVFVYGIETKELHHYVHSTRKTGSLINNVVDCLFEDRDGNIWLGTNCGSSLFYRNNPFRIYSWEDLVGSDEGNRIQCQYQDSRGNYWCGGTNGLGRYNLEKDIRQWFRMSDSRYHIAHNRVHQIFEDKEGTLWISTDGGIHRFDYEKSVFYHYQIVDSLRMSDANWAYGLFDDNKGNLWIASYLKGVFAVNKARIKKQNGGLYVADEHLCRKNGRLLSDKVCYAAIDCRQNIWVSTNQNGIHKIDSRTGKITFYSEQSREHHLRDNNVNCIIADKDRSLWVAEESGLDRIDVETGKVKAVESPLINNRRIDSVVDLGNWLGIVSGERFLLLDKRNEHLTQINLGGKRYTSACLDNSGQRVVLGGVDEILVLEWKKFLEKKNDNSKLIFASLRVMNTDVEVGINFHDRKILKKDLNSTDRIDLDYTMNGFEVRVCENRVRKTNNKYYSYRLEGLNDQWNELENLPASLSFNNLQPGKYRLQLKERDAKDPFRELVVVVHAPWYATGWAKAGYAVIVLLLAVYLFREYQIRNRLKLENLKKEKTLELSKLKMEFLTNISHELKTPLSLVMGPLGDVLPDLKNEKQQKKVRVAYDNSIKLNNLVHQILDYKESSEQSENLHLLPLELVEFVSSISSGLKEAFDSKGIELILEVPDVPLYIEADAVRMESAFTNILSNSLKYSLTGAKVVVRVTSEQGMALVEFKDTGVGIPKEDLEHVFNRFYQSEQNRKYNNEGSGIGLSLVKRSVELHGGQVCLTSEVGKGTIVCVKLPLLEKAQEKIIDTELAQKQSDKILLLVEDNEAIADYICSSFTEYTCLVAHNGRYGLEMAQKNHPHIIISDIMMPVMDGIEFLKALKKNVETALIPVIMLTAKDNPETETQTLSLGADAFISKPFDVDLLKSRVQRIISAKQQLVSKLRQNEIVQSAGVPLVVEESQDEKFLNEINRVIEEHLENADLNVQKLAEISGYSSKQIYRKLKELTGHTAVDYIKSIRLKKAAFLLSQHKFTVSEVMYMVGFSNSSYFSKCFSELYGKTPKQYMS